LKKSFFSIFGILFLLVLASCVVLNNSIYWIISVIVISLCFFFLINQIKNISSMELEYIQLKKDIDNIISKANEDNDVRNEIIDILEKLKIGFLGYRINNTSNNPQVEKVAKLINESMYKFNQDIDYSLQVLTEYGNANFAFNVETNNSSGKTGSLILGIKALGSSVSEFIALITKTAHELNSNIDILTTASNNLSVSSNQQAASLEETAAALEEITSTIISNTNNTRKMATFAKDVNIATIEGQKLANETAQSMEDINNQVTAINEAISVIDQIAFQTNILSLNAAVEAATAGEAGRGFAVVAGEVRNLASRSAEAAKEIKELVQNATSKANKGKDIATVMINGYSKLNENIENTIELINDITKASQEQQSGIEQINDAVTQLDQATQQNAKAAGDINSMAKNIQQLSTKLIETSNHATYEEKAIEQVCDMNLTMFLNRLKLDHVNFKNKNCVNLGTKKSWTVVNETECNLGKWIIQSENENKNYTKTSNWSDLKKVHLQVHKGMQDIIIENANDSNNETLKKQAEDLDRAIVSVFSSIQQVKIDNC
jgi:methyl-accepting chemotaxis protein